MQLRRTINNFLLGVGVASALCASTAMNSCSSTNQPITPPKPNAFQLGVNYVSWASGDYPYTITWRAQDQADGQGIRKHDITRSNPFEGAGSLEIILEADPKSDTHRHAEVFEDLRYWIPVYEGSSIDVQKDPSGIPLGVDFSGKTISANIFCERGTSGSSHAPNGIQVILKSVKIVSGKEVWSSYYSNWQNIYSGGPDTFADPIFGNIREGIWSKISADIPEEGSVIAPMYGTVDPGFDPSCVALIGIKYGTNNNNNVTINKRIFVDNFSWGSTGNALPDVKINFDQVVDPISALKKVGVNYVAINQTEYVDTASDVFIRPNLAKSHSDEELVSLIRSIHSSGSGTMLKPHVDVEDGTWRGDISPQDPSVWFENYTAFITHYAELAQANGVEVLCIGTEFKSLNNANFRDDWEKVIGSIMSVYNGKLTYAANWDDYKNVCFWDLLDFVGIDAYFPLSSSRDPSLNELVSGWSPWVEELSAWQPSVGKDILFTEIGYRSTDYAANAPSEFEEIRPVNPDLQARCYQSVFAAFEGKPWFKGVYFWNWTPLKDYGGNNNTNFTPQYKEAEQVLADGL